MSAWHWKKMIDLKPYGAFIEFTIRPLLQEIINIFASLRPGINLNEEKLARILANAAKLHFQHMILDFITKITVTIIMSATIIWMVKWTILQ